MNIKKRAKTSLLLIFAIWLFIYILPVWSFAIAASIFIGLGLSEYFNINYKNNFPRSFVYAGLIMGMALPYLTYFFGRWDIGWEPLFFIVALITLFLIQFTRKENNNAVVFIALTLFGVFYVGWFFTFLIKIRLWDKGHLLVTYLLVVTKAGDIGAYLFGSRFGKHALIPRISPKKSVEGMIGGFLFSVVFAIATSSIFLGHRDFLFVFISAVLIAGFAQLGDLSESLVKRDFQVKDSSFLLPGLGGFLDVIDSVLFTAPIFYIYLTMWK